jgi:opacity protein-like surface antigen
LLKPAIMKPTGLASLIAAALLSTATAARADRPADGAPAAADQERIGVTMGFRVGGYGFRDTEMEESGRDDWRACRMNGLGIYGHKMLRGPLFVEGGLDAYFSEAFPTGGGETGQYDTPIDRLSSILTVAGGVRWFQQARVSPYVLAGAGVELTRVRAPELGLQDSAVLPVGFFGFGADVKVGSRLRLGAAFRLNAMGYYDDSQFQTEMSPHTELATQGQFYAGYAL